MAYRVAGGLASLGIGKGDTVAIMLNNRWEFIPIDLGAAYLGGVPFSIYQTSSPEQIQYVCEDAEATVMIIESAFLDVFNEAKKDLPKLEHVIVVDGEGGTHTLEELEGIDPGFNGRESAEDIGPDDLPHPDLHLRHDRAAQGRPAHAAQPDDARRRPRRHDRVSRPGLQGHLMAARSAYRRARSQLLPADDEGRVGDDLRRSAQGRRGAADRQPDLLLRGSPHLGEGQGRPRGKARRHPGRGRREGPRGPCGRDQEGQARAGGRGGARGARSGRRGRRRGDVPAPAQGARPRRGALRERRARRRRRSRSWSSSTRSGSRSASSGACRRRAAPQP